MLNTILTSKNITYIGLPETHIVCAFHKYTADKKNKNGPHFALP